MKQNGDYFYICQKDDLKDSVGTRFYVNYTDIAVFKIKENIYVLSNICPHQHSPAIHEGFVENGSVVCPLHGWTFFLENGKLHNGNRGLESYPVKIDNGKIFSKIIPKELSW